MTRPTACDGRARNTSVAGRQNVGTWLALLAGLVMPALANAADFEPIERIAETATRIIKNRARPADTTVRVEVSRLDSRLRLPRCDQALAGHLPPGAPTVGRTAVQVECSGSRPWRLYVRMVVHVRMPVLVARHDLPRGHVITRPDLVLAERDLARVHAGFLQDPDRLLGRRLRAPLRAGAVVSRRVTAPVPVVRTGQPVSLEARTAGVMVRMAGTALADGRPGDRIRVRNERSEIILQGVVRGSGVVEVGP